jgi:hypothetical protein
MKFSGIHIIIVVTHETIDGQAPVHNNIWSSLWFRTAILSSPFYNMIVVHIFWMDPMP